MKKSLLATAVCLCLLLCVAAAVQAEAYTVPSGSLQTKLDYLRNVFPKGTYWNHWSDSELGSYTQHSFTINGHATSVSTKPCPKTHDGTSCNHCGWVSYKGYQCTGFARMMFNLLWDMDTETASYGMRYLPDTDDASLLDYVKPGDMVYTGGHMFIVTGVNATSYTVVHCNKNSTCDIRWDDTYTKQWVHDKMKQNKKGYVASPTPVKLKDDITSWVSYEVVSDSHDMLRWPSTASNVKKSCTMSKGSIFYADMNHIYTNSGKKFAYSKTADGKYGWTNISDTSKCKKVDTVTRVDSIPRIAVSAKAATGNSKDDQCYVKRGPYEAETTIRVEDVNIIIYLSGCVRNKYGNLWYITEDGGYIYSGDLEIKEPNITNQSETAFTAVAVVSGDTCALKEKPYEAAAHRATLSKGQTAQIVAKVVNYHGNVWYKTAEGKYIYSGSVDILTGNYSVYTNVNASFRWLEEVHTHALPYEKMPKVNKVTTGQLVTVKRVVVNDYGNLWAQLSDGNFLCLYDKETESDKGQFYECASEPSFTTSDLKLPKGELPYGKDFDVSCVIKGANGCPIAWVDAWIKDTNGLAAPENTVVMYFRKPTSSVNLATDLQINNKFNFAALAPGEYEFVIRGMMGFEYDGYPFYSKDGIQIFAESSFTIVKEESPEPPEACKHPSGTWKTRRAATCSAEGLEEYVCNDCGAVTNSRTIAKAGHTAGSWVIITEATETSTGLKRQSCTACGATLSEEVIPVIASGNQVGNVTFSAGSGLTGKAGSSVTVPVSIKNPDNVALGVISLGFNLPAGITISNVTACGAASNAAVLPGNPILVSEMNNGIAGSGKIVEVTLALDSSVVFPARIEIKPTINTLSPESEHTLAAFAATITNAPARIPGDVTSDGKVTTADFLRLGKYLAGWDDITLNSANADVTGDGKITTADFLRLGKYLAGWDVTLQ